MELSPEDQQQLQTARGIVGLVQQQQAGQPPLSPAQAQQLARELAPLAPQLLPGVAATGELFLRQLGKRAFDRLGAVASGSGPQQEQESTYRPMDP